MISDHFTRFRPQKQVSVFALKAIYRVEIHQEMCYNGRMILRQNNFRATILLLLLGFFALPVSAQDCNPGFTAPECEAEYTKLNNAGCLNTRTTIDPQGNPIPVPPDDNCDDFQLDYESCRAQCIPGVTNGNILAGPKNGATAKTYLLERFLPNITNAFLVFNMVIAVLFLVVSGIMWILASGSEEMKERAKNTIVWAIVGLTVSILAYVLVQFVININFFA